MVYEQDDADKALYEELLDNVSPTLRESLLCTGSAHQQGDLVMGFETKVLGGDDMIMTNQDYDNDSLCFVCDDKDKEGDVSTQGTLVRDLEYKGLPIMVNTITDGNKDPSCIMNKFSELTDNNEMAKQDIFVFDLESAHVPNDTTIVDQDSDSLCLSPREGTNSNITVGLPSDTNNDKDDVGLPSVNIDNDNATECEKGVPSVDKVMETLHSFEKSMEESRIQQEKLQMAIKRAHVRLHGPQSRTQKLQEAVEEASKNMHKSWKSELKMDLYIHSVLKEDVDLMQFCGGSKPQQVFDRVYFDVMKFSVKGEFNGEGFKMLSKELCTKAISAGFRLVRNGRKKRKNVGLCQEFVCNKSLIYKKWKHAQLDNFRRTSFNNDRKNSRGKDGKTMSRQVTTQRPVSRECRCKFCFYVGVDSRGFFVVPGYGSNVHTHHVKLNTQEIKFPTSLLPQDTRDVLADLINTNANLGVVVNFVEKRTGHLITRQNVHWLAGICSSLESIKGMEDKDSTEKMVLYLKEKNYDHMILYHKSNDKKLYNEMNPGAYLNQEGLTQMNTSSSNCTKATKTATDSSGFTRNILEKQDYESNGYTQSIALPTNENTDCQQYIDGTRISLKIEEKQDVMLGLAWVIPMEANFLRLYPEVVFVDVIAQTNKDDRPLFTATGKDCNGKMFTFLRVFLPNQQSWVFRWIFSVVFPNLFHKEILAGIRLIISDGCPQEFTNIDSSLGSVFPNAMRQRCGFHIIRMGWKSHVPGKNSFEKKHRVLFKNEKKNTKI